MIIKPRIRGYICTNAHPIGCAKGVEEQIGYLIDQKPILNGPKRVLVIGASMGYGLASRIVAAFGGSRAATIGVFFEKEPEDGKTGTAGWYNTAAFEIQAHAKGLYAKSFNGDAFSLDIKQKVAETIRKDWGAVDMIVYSLASARRTDPLSGETYRSVIKTIDEPCEIKTLDFDGWKFGSMRVEPANDEETKATVKVMGGEDWALWIDELSKEGLLAPGCKTVAYSYIGPEITRPVYRKGTLGKAKEHLEKTANELNEKLKSIGGEAFIAVNKALVTQASAAIPFIPLYYILLTQVLLAKGLDEGCIEQMYRLFAKKIFSSKGIESDAQGMVRMDDFELRNDVQTEVTKRWNASTQDNFQDYLDFNVYYNEFLKLFGFGFRGVDYESNVESLIQIPSIES
jgi:enoyl-[acyl-carrier protein] reductase/trans-2-enoyl-CoA reductase (NAD+)